MMIRLRSLGQCSIETPAARLGPEAEIVFATALYLAMERGRRVPRPAMARMLWPDASAARAAHCLRQALYRLRSLEVPLSSGRMHVTLPATAVDADYALLFESHGRRGVQDVVERLSGGFLPGYAPAFSEAYTEWLEQQRDTLNSAIRRVLVGEILAKKAIGDWRTVDLLARRCLTLDPLNEEATLALAESAAMHGSKAEALATLDRYLKEIGPEAREIRLPAIALRRRVAENTSHGQKSLLQAPFVGRKADFALLNSALVRAQRSSGSAYLISGEAGIGKTRLIGEFLRSAQLQHLHVVRVNCQSYDDQRPLSAFVDLVPQLLSVPGALGCSPDTMRYLQRIEKHDLTGPQPSNDAREAELLYSNVRRALFDLLDAITAEGCLVIAVEDGHWLDATSWKLLGEVVPWLATRKSLLVLTGRDGDSHFQQRRAAIRQLNHDRLVPLTKEESKELVGAVLRGVGRDFAPDFVDWCVATGCGNPYHLQELALHALHDGKSFSAPDSLRSLIAERLSRLPPLCLRVLQACAVLGKYSTLERLEAVLDQRRVDLLDALDALAGSNLIDCEGAHVLSRHDLLSAEALSLLSAASLRLLHRHAAMVLEGE
ncbi:MAG TPA: AAA family ATPase, partial [Gemmatimonadaceae bacterium]|nr:AAA family ATPase [Gemmatimonadaceae bacterium]